MKGYTMEVHRKIYDEENGHFVTVRPSADIPENVMLYVEMSEEEYFGKVRLELPAEMMQKIGEALILCAREVMEKK